MKRLLVPLLALVLSLTGAIAIAHQSIAISGKDFNPGRIIDDAIFYNSNSMTVEQIQAFLNSKMPGACDINGTGPAVGWNNSVSKATFAEWKRNGTNDQTRDSGFHAPPYYCLKEYRTDTPQIGAASGYCGVIPEAKNQSAAQIINSVAKACGINPQVFLVLLEKEQSLITDSWPLNRQYMSATGFACPDTADCDPAFRGLFQQIYNAGKQFKIYQAQPNHPDFNYRAGRTQRIYFQTNLGGFVNPTGNANDPSRNGNGDTCGYTNIYIENQATAALYIYTPYQPNQAALDNLRGKGDACSAYGNRNFWRMFNDWFGSTIITTIPACSSKVPGVVCVWNVTMPNGTQFLTTNRSELENVVYTRGWKYNGVSFYAKNESSPGLSAVYRLRTDSEYLYTADYGERSYLTKNGWTEEGIAFYGANSDDSNNIAHQLYSLYRRSDGNRILTISDEERRKLTSSGYTSSPGNFKTLSSAIPYSNKGNNLLNIYHLSSNIDNLYTTNLIEAENSTRIGYDYSGIFIQTSNHHSGTPMYRLQSEGVHLYTSNANERDIAISKYGFNYEGVAYYIDSGRDIFRLRNASSGKYMYIENAEKLLKQVNTDNWIYEGSFGNNNRLSLPVYRLVNSGNGRHIYTTDISEAANISNKDWIYENIAFTTPIISDTPIYRLRQNNKYLFTASESEKANARGKFGYVLEGIAFYASKSNADKPIYRLQGGSSDEYFYTSSKNESGQAQSKYGYVLEGVGFYTP